MGTYARNTSVGSEKSRAEIERTIARFGAEKFMYGYDQENAYIAFIYKGRAIRFALELPPKDKFKRTPSRGYVRTPEQAHAAWEQACRESWRALAILVKGKLAGIEQRISTFEKEFLPYTILPSGQTVSDWLEPQIQTLLETGEMPKLLTTGI